MGTDLISCLFTAGSYQAPENQTIHIYPCLVFLPPFTRDGDVTRHPTTQLLFPLTSLAADHNPQTQYSNGSSFVFFLFFCGTAMPGIDGIYIVCGNVRKANSWKQAENEIITVIKPELHILHHHVIGKRDSLDGSDSLRRYRGYWMHVLATENSIITCLQNRGQFPKHYPQITRQGWKVCLNFHWTINKEMYPHLHATSAGISHL